MGLVDRAKQFFVDNRPRHRLGQNFMIDGNTLDFIVAEADVKDKVVLEIGPGLGFLTERLAKKAKKVVAIEMDKGFAKELSKLSVEVLLGDACKVDLPDFDVCVANLPYQISSPFTFRLLEQRFEKAILTYQLEFAKRLTARPGTNEWSRLGATASFLAEARLLRKVPRSCFWPQPKVDSAVVSLAPREKPKDWARIKQVIDMLFNQPRKKVRNAFKPSSEMPKFGEKRVRELTPQEIVELTTLL